MADLTKLTVLLTGHAMASLDEAAQICGDTRTDTVNRALLVYAAIVLAAERAAAAESHATATFEWRESSECTVIVMPKRVTS